MKWYESTEERMAELREKYCRGLCSEEYIKTGVPRMITEKISEVEKEIPKQEKKAEKKKKKAVEVAKKQRRKRKLKIEDQLIFI